jgi:hypothetical protein
MTSTGSPSWYHCGEAVKAPKIFVVVGLNRNEGRLLAWFFTEEEARAKSDEFNTKYQDSYATGVEPCEAGDTIPEVRSWW